jgi:hypothetical protein
MPSNAELAQQLKEAREKLAKVETAVPEEVIKENEALKKELVLTKEEKEAAEERLTASIAAMQVPEIVDGMAGENIHVMTPDEYRAWGKKNGTIMGRKAGQKTECSIEELRALINSNWAPSMVMEKHGIDDEELKQLVWRLSKAELRDNPIRYSIERDFFGREG